MLPEGKALRQSPGCRSPIVKGKDSAVGGREAAWANVGVPSREKTGAGLSGRRQGAWRACRLGAAPPLRRNR
jgi:hypothetical protein